MATHLVRYEADDLLPSVSTTPKDFPAFARPKIQLSTAEKPTANSRGPGRAARTSTYDDLKVLADRKCCPVKIDCLLLNMIYDVHRVVTAASGPEKSATQHSVACGATCASTHVMRSTSGRIVKHGRPLLGFVRACKGEVRSPSHQVMVYVVFD